MIDNKSKLMAELRTLLEEIVRGMVRPLEEAGHRTAGLLAQTRNEIDNESVHDAQEYKELTATLSAHRQRIEKLEGGASGSTEIATMARRLDSFLETVTARLRALEGTGHGTASPAHINVVQLHNTITDVANNHRNRIGEVENRAQALAKRVDQLEAGRTGHAQQRHVWIGPGEPQGPPPGVPAFAGYADAFKPQIYEGDPTTAAIEQLTKERDEKQRVIVQRNTKINELATKLVALEKAHTEALANRVALEQSLETIKEQRDHNGRIATAAQAGVAELQKIVDEQRDERTARHRAEQNKATALFDSIGVAIGMQPLGSREQITAAALDWIKRTGEMAKERNDQTERLIEQRVAVENLLADARHARDEAERREQANAASCRDFAERVRQLEEQARGRDKLAAMRLTTFEALQDRIRTVADEKFGPFPVQSADDALSAIEQGCFFLRMDDQAGRKLFDTVKAWSAGDNSKSVSEAIDAYEVECKRVQGMREAGMARFYGPPVPENDCQAGTCDCPSGPSYEVKHKNDPGDADIPF